MIVLLDKLITCSEVLGLLIPLIVILLYKPQGNGVNLLKWYVIVAFVVNLIAALMYLFYRSLPENLNNNNILYNIHSVSRVVFFSLYIMSVRKFKHINILRGLLAAYAIFVIYNFIFLEDVLFLSTNLFSAESVVLLVMCLSYFFRSIQDDTETNWLKHPSFLVVSGVLFYEAITFFIFLFFYPLLHNDEAFSLATMRIYALTFVVLCILLGRALYKSRKSNMTLSRA